MLKKLNIQKAKVEGLTAENAELRTKVQEFNTLPRTLQALCSSPALPPQFAQVLEHCKSVSHLPNSRRLRAQLDAGLEATQAVSCLRKDDFEQLLKQSNASALRELELKVQARREQSRAALDEATTWMAQFTALQNQGSTDAHHALLEQMGCFQ